VELATGTADSFSEFCSSSRCTYRDWPSSPKDKSSCLLLTSLCSDSVAHGMLSSLVMVHDITIKRAGIGILRNVSLGNVCVCPVMKIHVVPCYHISVSMFMVIDNGLYNRRLIG
jgi:hypothetical protein